MEVKPGYKESEVGVIPEEWVAKALGDVFSLQHGFAFSSHYFSKTGPIVLTPGNFALNGGLYFEERNTKRYSGPYSSSLILSKHDLLIVMTDLTPDCNLLGKPAFVEIDEVILHNQRIGKVHLKDKSADQRFLFYSLLSRPYLDRIKEQATGSTVRHTSNKSIYCVQLAWASPLEQRAIAEVLTDLDGLLGGLDRLIAKKRDLKQAAMQQLLTGQTRLPGFNGEWRTASLKQLAELQSGINKPTSAMGSGTLYVTVQDLYERTSIPVHKLSRLQVSPAEVQQRELRVGDIVFAKSSVKREGIGYPSQFLGCKEPVIFSGFTYRARARSAVADATFLFYALRGEPCRRWLIDNSQASALTNINKTIAENVPVRTCPLAEQTAIAEVLAEMDAELSALEQRREKTRGLKQAMMQELLTGKTRLVARGLVDA